MRSEFASESFVTAQSLEGWKRGQVHATLSNKRQEPEEFLQEAHSSVNDNTQVALNSKGGSGERTG